MFTKKEAAHVAARRCFSVFPIRWYVDPGPDATKDQIEAAVKAAKAPLIANWQSLATQDPKQIDAWWDEWPDANIGGVTEDLIVVDIDPRNGAEATMQALLDLYEFPTTVRNETQGGGDHLIYAVPHPVKGGTNKLGKGVDIKARGGYILLPGSTIEGRAYKWMNDRQIAPAPQWIVDQCKAVKAKTDAAGKRLVEEDDTAVEMATNWMLNKAPTAEYGEIDDTTYKVAARLYDFGVSLETATEIMLEWNETKCFPPGDMERLLVVTESAGRNRENAIGKLHPLTPGFEAVEIDESKAPTEAGIPVSKSTATLKAENFFDAADMALTDLAEPLIKGVIDRGAMSILYGESNTGKTFIAIDISFHVATARAWTGRKTRQGCVVYVAAEGGRGVYKRLAALRKAHPEFAVVPLYTVKFPIDLLHGPEHAKALVKICQDVAAESGCTLELIVIDTLSRAMSGGDENSSTDMGGIVKSFDAIREVTGAHLMVIHHSGKDRAKGARGHSLLRAATDTEIEVERGRVTVTKQRDMDGEFKQAFKLKSVNIGRDSDGAHVTSCVVEFISREVAEAGPQPVSRGLSELVNALDSALAEHPEQPFGIGFVHQIKADHNPDHTFSRTTLVGNMSELVEAGWFLKVSPDQYVRRLVGKSRPD